MDRRIEAARDECLALRHVAEGLCAPQIDSSLRLLEQYLRQAEEVLEQLSDPLDLFGHHPRARVAALRARYNLQWLTELLGELRELLEFLAAAAERRAARLQRAEVVPGEPGATWD